MLWLTSIQKNANFGKNIRYSSISKSINRNFEKASELISKYHNLTVQFESVNLFEALPFSKKYDIKSFPTMQYFKNANPTTLEGRKSVANIYNFVLQQNGLKNTKIQNQEQLEEFANLRCKLIFQELENPQDNTIVLDYDQKETMYYRDGFVSETEFYQDPVLEFGEKSVDLIFAENIPGIIFLGNDIEKEKVFRNVAQNKSDITFSICNTLEDEIVCNKLSEFLGVSEYPAIFIIQPLGHQKYKFEGNYTEEEILQFIIKFEKMEIDRFLKSEEIYKDQKLRVKSIVGADFEERVLENDQDVVVNFYSMECDSSRRYNLIFERVAKMLEFEDIEFYQLNALKNEIRWYKVHYYPSIYYFRKGKSVRMQGENTEENLIMFIRENKQNEQSSNDIQ